MRVKKIFVIEYEDDDCGHWLNEYNLQFILDNYASGGKPYKICEMRLWEKYFDEGREVRP